MIKKNHNNFRTYIKKTEKHSNVNAVNLQMKRRKTERTIIGNNSKSDENKETTTLEKVVN